MIKVTWKYTNEINRRMLSTGINQYTFRFETNIKTSSRMIDDLFMMTSQGSWSHQCGLWSSRSALLVSTCDPCRVMTLVTSNLNQSNQAY